MALMINEVLRKIILASRLEFLLLCFLVENYGTLLLAESDTTERLNWTDCLHHSEIIPIWLIPSAFLFVYLRNVHRAKYLFSEYDAVEERVRNEDH